jgi:hypothetical protein
MKVLSSIVMFFFCLSFVGCAKAVTQTRDAYILAQPHGWIEIEVLDTEVFAIPMPPDLTEEERANWQSAPPACFLTVTLNNEQFISENIFPFGEESPYKVDTGFRFPAPIGDFKITLIYSGCDIEEGESTSITLSTKITVHENMVTPILFDGVNIFEAEAEDNSVITLDDIYKKLEDIEEKNK